MESNEKKMIYSKRYNQIINTMRESKLDCIILCPSPNLYYITGYSPKLDERTQIALIALDREPVLLVPKIYAAEAKKQCWIENQRAWKDGDDICGMVASLLTELGLVDGCIGVDDTMEFRQVLHILNACTCQLKPVSALFSTYRMIKEPVEVQLLEMSGQIADEVMGLLIQKCTSGISEIELKEFAEFELRRRGISNSFSNIVASGPNSAFPHHVSDHRIVSEGDVLILDIGGTYKKYWSDITRTIFIGTPDAKKREIYQRVREAQEVSLKTIKPGVMIGEIHNAAVKYFYQYGLDRYLLHRVGHGIGLEGHEEPSIIEGNRILLEPGMTFTVEPGIYIDGEFGIRIEDSIVVTETGYKLLNRFPRHQTMV